MKNILAIIFLCIITWSCNKSLDTSKITVCGVNDPKKNIPWLTELIQKAEDKNADLPYVGTIWIVKYKGQDIIVSDISLMRSSSLMYHCFDCSGNLIKIDDSEDFFEHMKKNGVIIFSNWEH